MGNLVVIRTYSAGHLAHLDVAKLADEGIESEIHNETLSTMLPYLQSAIGGVKLLVQEDDAERAISILEVEADPSDFPDEYQPVEPLTASDQCPWCGSRDVGEKRSKLPIWLSFLTFFGGATPSKVTHRCNDCRHEWD